MTKKQEILNTVASALFYLHDRGELEECIQEIENGDHIRYTTPPIPVDNFVIVADDGTKYVITAEPYGL